jgi:two-component system, NtrC family, response regulator AtoC
MDDDKDLCSLLSKIFEKKGCITECQNEPHNFVEKFKKNKPDLVLLDVMLPLKSGIEVLSEIKAFDPDIPVIMISNRDDAKMVVSAMKAGAYDYIPKTSEPNDIWDKVKKLLELQELKKTEKKLKLDNPIIGQSSATKNLVSMIGKVSQAEAPVFLRGESGTGKSLIAETIHKFSKRSQKPFITINCPSIPSGLLESELFGHEKGSFTSAIKTKEGKFELADQGTVFLDEIGDLPLDLQVKILRVIQNKEFERVGGLKTIKKDVRIIAATNKDVETAVSEGKFREDLYYRLNVLPVYIPPLRERREDIPVLTDYFVKFYSEREKKNFNKLSQEVLDFIADYDWPGNIRELENSIERAVILGKEPDLKKEDFNIHFTGSKKSLYNGDSNLDSNKNLSPSSNLSSNSEGDSKRLSLKEMEYKSMVDALSETSGNISKAAQILGISRDTLYRRMKKHGVALKS